MAGSAETALGNYEGALEQLVAAQDDMERQIMIADWIWCMWLESGLTDLWLAKGDLAQAETQAKRFLNVTLSTAERTCQALAWEANARVAAATDLMRAKDCITAALSTMEGFEVPLAAWRVHATAAELCERMGDRDLAQHQRTLSRARILELAHSLIGEETLRKTFLSAPSVRKILG
ncbi:MAG TPA: hypothetical protein VKM54_15230 [Myxococcota bacterium]|nr:hypothetical protein [Myxococcota bacterium]